MWEDTAGEGSVPLLWCCACGVFVCVCARVLFVLYTVCDLFLFYLANWVRKRRRATGVRFKVAPPHVGRYRRGGVQHPFYDLLYIYTIYTR